MSTSLSQHKWVSVAVGGRIAGRRYSSSYSSLRSGIPSYMPTRMAGGGGGGGSDGQDPPKKEKEPCDPSLVSAALQVAAGFGEIKTAISLIKSKNPYAAAVGIAFGISGLTRAGLNSHNAYQILSGTPEYANMPRNLGGLPGRYGAGNGVPNYSAERAGAWVNDIISLGVTSFNVRDKVANADALAFLKQVGPLVASFGGSAKAMYDHALKTLSNCQ